MTHKTRYLLLAALLLASTDSTAADGWLGTLTSSGTSVNNLTASPSFSLPSPVGFGSLRFALQCSAPVHYRLGTSSSTAAVSTDYLVNTQLVFDVSSSPVVIAVISDSAASTCQVFQTSAPSGSSPSGSTAAAPVRLSGCDGGPCVTADQGAPAASSRAWPVYLTDAGIGSTTAPLSVQVLGGDGGVLQVLPRTSGTRLALACGSSPCSLGTSSTLVVSAGAKTGCHLENPDLATIRCCKAATCSLTAFDFTLAPDVSAPDAGAAAGFGGAYDLTEPVWTGPISCITGDGGTIAGVCQL